MITPLAIALGAVAGAEWSSTSQEPVSKDLRGAVLESIEGTLAPMSFEVEERVYRVDLGCELGRQLRGHLTGRSAVDADSLAGLVEFIEECVDIEDDNAIASEVTDSYRHYRTSSAGGRRLHEALDDRGELVWAMVVDGDRQARFEVAKGPDGKPDGDGQGALRVGPKEPSKPDFEGTSDHMAPLPVTGPWFEAMGRTGWVERPAMKGQRVLAPLDRDGRRLDIALDLPEDATEGGPKLPHRVVATYYGIRGLGGEANLFAWSSREAGVFLTDTLRISAGEETLEVRHVMRSQPTFGLRAKDVRLVIPRPDAVEVAGNAGWSSFRRREVLPSEWKDLVETR